MPRFMVLISAAIRSRMATGRASLLCLRCKLQLRHWEGQSPVIHKPLHWILKKNAHQKRACVDFERIRRYRRDHVRIWFSPIRVMMAGLELKSARDVAANNCRGFSEKTRLRNACLQPSGKCHRIRKSCAELLRQKLRPESR